MRRVIFLLPLVFFGLSWTGQAGELAQGDCQLVKVDSRPEPSDTSCRWRKELQDEDGVPTLAQSQEISKDLAIATVRSILTKNAKRDKIDKIISIEAIRVKPGWQVTANIVLSASGKPREESPAWIVRDSDGVAVPSSQLSAELSAP